MSINISDFVLESAHQDNIKKRERTAEYYAKMHLQEDVTILTIRIHHDDEEMMEFYNWLVKHYPTKRKNGSVDMDRFIQENKDRIMEEK